MLVVSASGKASYREQTRGESSSVSCCHQQYECKLVADVIKDSNFREELERALSQSKTSALAEVLELWTSLQESEVPQIHFRGLNQGPGARSRGVDPTTQRKSRDTDSLKAFGAVAPTSRPRRSGGENSAQ